MTALPSREFTAAAKRVRDEAHESARAAVGYRVDGAERPGMKPFRRFSLPSLLNTFPGAVSALGTVVPESHVQFRDDHAEVTCACEALPVLVYGGCSALCSCGRIFVHLGDQVRVVKTEEQED